MAFTKPQKERMVAAIQDEMTNAEGGHSSESVTNRATALRYYQGAPRGDERANRSQVVAMDLAAATESTLAIMRGMLILECSAEFEAESTDDEPLAKAESDIVRDLIYKDNRGEKILLTAMKDGLLSRQAVIGIDVEEGEEYHNVITIRAVPSENIAYQNAYEGQLQDIRFFSEMVPYTRSDLVEMGCDRKEVEKLSTRSAELWNSASDARNNTKTGQHTSPEAEGDTLECYWVYIKLDVDDDGIAERYRVLYCDNTVLKDEEFDVIPYAIGSPFITPHRLTGESLFDRLKQIQDSNTALQRQLMDNIQTVVNGRVVYDPSRADEEDIMTPEAGGGIRSRDPANSVVPLIIPDVTGGILGGLEYMRRRRGEVAGASLDMASAEAQLMHKSATQASIDKSNAELITSLVAHNFSQGLIHDLFFLARHYLRTYATRPYLARVHGQAVPVNPLEWRPNRRLTVTAGMSPGEKAAAAMALGQHVALQAQAMAQGMNGILADAATIYRSQMDFLKLSGIQDPERYAIDPRSQQAQQAQQQQAQAQQAAQQAQEKMMKETISIETSKIAEDARQHDQELQFKYVELETEAEIDGMKVAAQAEIDLEKQARDHTAQAQQSERAAENEAKAAASAA